MAEIKTLHLVPREGMQVSEKPSVVRVRFGDGYEQRRPTGLNPQLKTFQAVFRVTDEVNQALAGRVFIVAWWLPCLFVATAET